MLGTIQKGAVAIGLATIVLCPTAEASTAVYTFGGLLSGTLKECLSNAKRAASKSRIYRESTRDSGCEPEGRRLSRVQTWHPCVNVHAL